MADTTQINFRIPVDLKTQAQEKAESYGTNLNFLVKLFLTKFVK
jgi:antitoxin component of RelBE/YafQ-DinJ toxin-antitoxin module